MHSVSVVTSDSVSPRRPAETGPFERSFEGNVACFLRNADNLILGLQIKPNQFWVRFRIAGWSMGLAQA